MTTEWSDYEFETLRQAREMFARWDADDGDISDVRLALAGDDEGDAELVVTFAHRDRPGCRFSYTWPLHGWNDDDPEQPDEEVPDTQVMLLWANLSEDLCAIDYGLPSNCRPGEVVELGRRPIVIELELAIRRVLSEYAGRLGGNDVELADKLVKAVDPIAEHHARVWYTRWEEAVSARSQQQQTDGSDTPLDP